MSTSLCATYACERLLVGRQQQLCSSQASPLDNVTVLEGLVGGGKDGVGSIIRHLQVSSLQDNSRQIQ